MKRAVLTQEQAMFSRQKRWLSEESILRSIDNEMNIQRDYCLRAENLLAEADSYLRMANDETLTDQDRGIYSNRYKQAKQESDDLFSKANRKDERLKMLGQKLSAFRTQLLSFTNDPAVV